MPTLAAIAIVLPAILWQPHPRLAEAPRAVVQSQQIAPQAAAQKG